jgi:hypothetical protein
MALTIWKYPWPTVNCGPGLEAGLNMPEGAEILTAREQGDDICIWARVDPYRAIVKRHFVLCGTGHPTPGPEATYVGTGLLYGGRLVLHVFETSPGGSDG